MINKEYFTEASIAKFVEFSKTIYGDDDLVTNENFVRNKHLENPDGESLYLEFKTGELVTGRLAVQFRKAAEQSKLQVLKNPVDLISIGRHPFGGLNLYKEAIALELSMNRRGTYHTSNPKSEIFYRRILKEEPLAELGYKFLLFSISSTSFYSFFINPVLTIIRVFVEKILELLALASNLKSSSISESTESQMESLFSDEDKLVLYRDAKRLSWRFPEVEGFPEYQKIEFYKGDDFCGYLVFRRIQSHGYAALLIVDFYTSNLNHFDKAKIYRRLISASQGMNMILIIANFSNKKIRRQFDLPFLLLPNRMVPQKFPIYSPAIDRVNNLDKFSYLTLFDLDIL